MPVRRKRAAKKAPTTPKSVDKMIDERPAHSTNVMREYLRQLLKGGK